MSTRSMLAVQRNDNGSYELYYHHCDGYPTWLGLRIAEQLRDGVKVDDLLKTLEFSDEQLTVEKPEDAFLKVQGDLEWIYVIRGNGSTRSLSILKTSCPTLLNEKDFVFSTWFSYVDLFPEDLATEMRCVGKTARIVLNGLSAFAKA